MGFVFAALKTTGADWERARGRGASLDRSTQNFIWCWPPSGRGSERGRAPAAENSSFSFICARVCLCVCGDGTRRVFIPSGSRSRPPARSTPPGCPPSFPAPSCRGGSDNFFLEYRTRGFKGPPPHAPPGPAWDLLGRLR